jgi:hypothetical protein
MQSYQVNASDEERFAFDLEFKVAELNATQYATVLMTCLPGFLVGYRAAKRDAERVTKKESERLDACAKLEEMLDYPNAWDTAAYPNVESASIKALHAANAAADEFAKTLQNANKEAHYTMDQMRDYAEGVFTTRAYLVIDSIGSLASDYTRKSEKLHEDGRNLLGGVYEDVSVNLTKLAENAKNLGKRPFQKRTQYWAKKCFGMHLATDHKERNQRFAEEALELVQACGMTRLEALGAVKYVYGRPVGDKLQEVGGVYNTLAVLCAAHGIDMVGEGERDLLEIDNEEATRRIREKRMTKPDFAEVDLLTEAKFLEVLNQIPGAYGYMMREDGGGLSPNGIYNLERVKNVLHS